jgi:hypothetical protein
MPRQNSQVKQDVRGQSNAYIQRGPTPPGSGFAPRCALRKPLMLTVGRTITTQSDERNEAEE